MMELEDAKGVKKSMELYGNSLLMGIEELSYFVDTVLSYSEFVNQKKIEKPLFRSCGKESCNKCWGQAVNLTPLSCKVAL